MYIHNENIVRTWCNIKIKRTHYNNNPINKIELKVTDLWQFTPDGDTSTNDFLGKDEVELRRSQS